MKVMIDLGTADVEMQRNDGTWEKVDHCRIRVNVEKALLKVELAAVLTGAPLDEVIDAVSSAAVPETINEVIERKNREFAEFRNRRSVRPKPTLPPPKIHPYDPNAMLVITPPKRRWFFWK